MKDNLPVEEKSFFGKIKLFFRNLFYKNNENEIENVQESKVIITNDEIREKFKNSIRFEVKNEFVSTEKRETFLNGLDDNLDILYDIPTDQLEEIEEAYKASIEHNEEKLKNLKKAS